MMRSDEPIRRVRIYLSERDQAEGQALYITALERLRREGATGATALRGVAGFGPGHRARAAGPADLNPAPIVVEWVDRAERVARVLPVLDDLLPDALITIEDLYVYRAVLRSSGPFGERTVGDVTERDIACAGREMLLREAAQLLLDRRQALLPILDDRGLVVGVLAASDLVRRAGLPMPIRLLKELAPPERAALLDALPARTLADTMTAEPRTVYVESPIPLAINPLVEWGLSALPVLDRDGQLAGLFGIEQALRATLDARPSEAGPVRDAEPPTPVGLVMQRAVPIVAAEAPLADALAQVLAAPERFVVVVGDGRPIGTLSDSQLLGRLQDPLRAAWLAALRAPERPFAPPADAVMAGLAAGSLADAGAPMLSSQDTQDNAIRQMLDGDHERLVVVDSDGRLAGLLARRGLLRALAQTSAG